MWIQFLFKKNIKLKKKILISESSGFIEHSFLKDTLNKNYYIVDILKKKNKDNKRLIKLKRCCQNGNMICQFRIKY